MHRTLRFAAVAGVALTSHFAAGTALGFEFGPPAEISPADAHDRGGDTGPDVAVDASGRAIAVWTSTDAQGGSIGSNVVFASSGDGGSTWSSPGLIAPGEAPRIATDGAGTWVLVWKSGAHVVFSRFEDGGSWSTPGLLEGTGEDRDPFILTDGSGTWITAWSSKGALGGRLGSDFDILFAVSRDGGRTFSPPAPLNTNAASDQGDDVMPALAADRMGGFVAVWQSNESFEGPPSPNQSILYATSSGGSGWSYPLTLGSGVTPDVAYERAGAFIAVWSSASKIMISSTGDGGGSWTGAARMTASSAHAELQPRIASDHAGGWLTVFTVRDLVLGGSWIAHSQSSGDSAAFVDAATLAPGEHHQRPAVATDGQGVWLAVWDAFGHAGSLDSDVLFARSPSPLPAQPSGQAGAARDVSTNPHTPLSIAPSSVVVDTPRSLDRAGPAAPVAPASDGVDGLDDDRTCECTSTARTSPSDLAVSLVVLIGFVMIRSARAAHHRSRRSFQPIRHERSRPRGGLSDD